MGTRSYIALQIEEDEYLMIPVSNHHNPFGRLVL